MKFIWPGCFACKQPQYKRQMKSQADVIVRPYLYAQMILCYWSLS